MIQLSSPINQLQLLLSITNVDNHNYITIYFIYFLLIKFIKITNRKNKCYCRVIWFCNIVPIIINYLRRHNGIFFSVLDTCNIVKTFSLPISLIVITLLKLRYNLYYMNYKEYSIIYLSVKSLNIFIFKKLIDIKNNCQVQKTDIILHNNW